MRKKIFTFLLALVTSVGMMNAKVTWNSSNIFDLYVSGTYQSYSKEGVTLSANADQIDAWWFGFGDESMDGISFNMHNTGGFTFSNTLGKNFTKIEMFLIGPAGWDYANLGSGWSFYWDYTDNSATVTWTGNASTVDLLKEASDFNGTNVKSIVFYFEGDSEDPDPTYTVALEDGTVNADKVTLSATSAVEGATVTVTPDEEYEITAFKATYNTTEELSTSFNAETGAYSFTMPAYDVTIEATIALKPVPEGDIFAGFTATAGSGGFNNEGSANLVDNKFTPGDEQTNWTKWCANDGHKSVPTGESGDACWWIDFEASAALNPTGYILTTGNDTGSEHGRNPKNWLLKAKLNADDAWTTIATVTDDATMKNKSFKDYKFFVDQSGSYQYFRFEVFANQGAGVMQLCELRLIGSEAPAPAPKYYVVGTMNSWQVNEAYEMTPNNSAETEEYMFTLDLTTTSEFKVKKMVGETETWYPSGSGNNYGQNGEIKEDGNYTIYFRPNGDGGDDWFHNVIYVAKNPTPEPEVVDITYSPANANIQWYDNLSTYFHYWEMIATGNSEPIRVYLYSTAEGRSEAAGTYTMAELDEYCGISNTETEENIKFTAGSCTVTVDGDKVIIAGTFTGNDGKTYNISISNFDSSEDPEPDPKYYIVGTMTDWQVKEDYEMKPNNSAETEEYMFTIDLTTTDQFKVVKETDEDPIYYPDGMGNNYGENGEITADGNYTIYFRPNADGGEGWFYNVIYVEKNGSTAIDEVDSQKSKVESRKIIENGQLFIIRDGKTYTVTGQQIK